MVYTVFSVSLLKNCNACIYSSNDRHFTICSSYKFFMTQKNYFWIAFPMKIALLFTKILCSGCSVFLHSIGKSMQWWFSFIALSQWHLRVCKQKRNETLRTCYLQYYLYKWFMHQFLAVQIFLLNFAGDNHLSKISETGWFD